MIKIVVGSFDSFGEASQAARDLRAAGFLDSDVNVVASNVVGDEGRTDAPAKTIVKEESHAAATGAVAGGALGGAAGLAISLMGLAIPGIGPILAAGPIAAALAGAGAGAVAGGLIGGLTDLGVPKADAEYYAEAVRRGGALVTVRADASRADDVLAIMHRNGAFDIEDRVQQWQNTGWKGYDPSAEPYTADEILRDRNRYVTGAEAELRR